MILDALSVPIVLAPLAGGPSTPELTAAVAEAGGLGSIASGYVKRAELEATLAATRALSERPLAVNLFVPGTPTPPETYAAFAARVTTDARARGLPVGEPRFEDDDWSAKLELLRRDPVAVVSFTFGCPEPGVLASLRAVGSETWVTVTCPEEARRAAAAGADVLIVQGGEAGGHRGGFIDRPGTPVYALLPLLQLVSAAVPLPLVAAGGIADGAGLAAVLAGGARAGQLGTAFLRCPEAGTSAVHRTAIAGDGRTDLTRAFTGRLARGVHNRFMDDHGAEAPSAYPEIHHLTAPLRRAARERGEDEVVNLWAGEAHALAQDRPAAEVVREIAAQARLALAEAQRALG